MIAMLTVCGNKQEDHSATVSSGFFAYRELGRATGRLLPKPNKVMMGEKSALNPITIQSSKSTKILRRLHICNLIYFCIVL
ncbi:hypothetical protein FKM82_007644 [Ascaphus truei]